jgi:Phage tail tube protein
MTIAAGDLQLAFGEESTFNTTVTPTRVIEVTDENLKTTIDRVDSKGLRTQRTLASKTNWNAGNIDVGGDIGFEVSSRGMGLLFKHMLGVTSPTLTTPAGGTNAKKQSYGLSATETTDGKSLTIEAARTDITGTRQKFVYGGCKVASWELSVNAGEVLMGKITVDGASETATTASATSLTYPTGVPLVYTGAAISVGGSTFSVKQFDLKGENGLQQSRYMLGSSTKKEQLQTAIRAVSGTLTCEWSGLTAYQRFINGTTASLSATFSTVSAIEGSLLGSVTITIPDVRFDGDTPNTNPAQIIEHPLNFVVLDDESTATAPITIDYVSLDTAA